MAACWGSRGGASIAANDLESLESEVAASSGAVDGAPNSGLDEPTGALTGAIDQWNSLGWPLCVAVWARGRPVLASWAWFGARLSTRAPNSIGPTHTNRRVREPAVPDARRPKTNRNRAQCKHSNGGPRNRSLSEPRLRSRSKEQPNCSCSNRASLRNISWRSSIGSEIEIREIRDPKIENRESQSNLQSNSIDGK